MSKNDKLEERKMCRKTRNDVEGDDDSDEQSHYDDEAVPIRLRRKSFYTKSYNPEEDLDETEIKLFPKTDEVKMRLESSIKDNLLFRSLEPEQLSSLIDAMEELNVNAGNELIRAGDDNYGFYVIDNGEYEIKTVVSCGLESVKRVQSGTFGELTLLHNQPSRSTVTAKTNGKLYALNRNDFRKIVTKTTHELRKDLEELINKIPQLKDLTEFEKLKIADVLELANFSDGDVIVKEGECSNGVYIVIRGSVRIAEKTDSGNREVIVGSGEHFGELPASKPSGSCSSAIAVGSTKVALLKAEAFERLMGPCLKVLKKNPSHSRKPTNL